AKVKLINGLELMGNPNLQYVDDNKELQPDVNAISRLVGELVTVSSYTTGQISLSKLGSSGAAGELDLSKLTLGTASLSPAVKIFERVGTGSVEQISLSDLTQTKISASKVVYARKDYAGRVDLLVLNDVTGDRYEYGILMEKLIPETDWNGKAFNNRAVYIMNRENQTDSEAIVTGQAITKNAPGGIAVSADGKKLEAVVTLTEVKNVSRTAFYTVGGKTYLHLSNMDIMVADKPECYNKLTNTWFEGLADARAFADTLTVYYDRAPAEGGKIRMVVAG
ncbi:MAG: hypothetical protein GX847_00155, partial [Clostridiales bacterium]|nr:hypothetical protein [Clostridiales bacterium]